MAGISQAFYCIGSTYALLKNYVKAIEFHEQHLAIATEMGDTGGMVRAWYNLRNASHAMQNTEKTVYYHKLIQEHQREADSRHVVAQGSRQSLGLGGGRRTTAEGAVVPDAGASRNSSGASGSGAAAVGTPEVDKGGKASKSSGRGSKNKPEKQPKKSAPKTKGPATVMAFEPLDSSSDDDADVVTVRVDHRSVACTMEYLLTYAYSTSQAQVSETVLLLSPRLTTVRMLTRTSRFFA